MLSVRTFPASDVLFIIILVLFLHIFKGGASHVRELEDHKTKHGIIGTAFHEQKHHLVRLSAGHCRRPQKQTRTNKVEKAKAINIHISSS